MACPTLIFRLQGIAPEGKDFSELSYIPFIIILCAMVVIHEFGHFIVAKLLGIAVETFSVGFGPRLLGFRIGETDYRLSAVPLGGYVKFRGENLEMIQGKSEGSVDEFLSHPKWKRFLVAIAGPVFNIVTAIAIPTAAILVGFQDNIYRSQQMIVGIVRPGSAAEAAGLRPGDRILSYGQNQSPTWDDFNLDVRMRPNEELPLKIERNGQALNPVVTLKSEMMDREQVGSIGIEPYLDSVKVAQVTSNSPAERAGLKAGDKIVAVADEPISAWTQFREALTRTNGQPVTLKINRAGTVVDLQAAPQKDEKTGDFKLGFFPDLTAYVKTNSIATAVKYGLDYNWRILRMTGVMLKQIFTGQRSVRNALAGPIGIAEVTSETYKAAGWSGTIQLMGILSLNLGVFNLLPIPVLDGGMILLLIVEGLLGLIGVSLTMNMRERFQQVGFVIVMLLMGFVIINDVVKVGERFFSSPPAAQPANK
ncbi:MAG: RIP metalloprotease RseP [Acidobacteriota bacterium]